MTSDTLRQIASAVAPTLVEQVGEGVREWLKRRAEDRAAERERWAELMRKARVDEW